MRQRYADRCRTSPRNGRLPRLPAALRRTRGKGIAHALALRIAPAVEDREQIHRADERGFTSRRLLLVVAHVLRSVERRYRRLPRALIGEEKHLEPRGAEADEHPRLRDPGFARGE